ncbi:MAG: Aldehyde reductase [Bacteroidetes bacterium]|nr:Aldehyde reductase [Bacteroidota bacterium]
MKKMHFMNGDRFPQIGLGTWLSKTTEVYDAVIEAIGAGYRHIDCAYIYKNEKEIGEALQHAFSTGLVSREEMFITSKLWNNFHAPQDVEKAIRISLENLKLDYLDLYLIHWPLAFRQEQARSTGDLVSLEEIPLTSTWKSMEAVKKSGLTKHIGVSNFNIPKLKDLIANSEIKPEVNQIELHPYLQQNELVRFCQDNSILVTAYSPLGSHHLTDNENSILLHPVIKEIARKHHCTEAQVALAWGIQRSTAVIPKSVNYKRIHENIGTEKIQLDDKDMESILTLNRNHRNAKAMFAVFPGGPYTLESIWDE